MSLIVALLLVGLLLCLIDYIRLGYVIVSTIVAAIVIICVSDNVTVDSVIGLYDNTISKVVEFHNTVDDIDWLESKVHIELKKVKSK